VWAWQFCSVGVAVLAAWAVGAWQFWAVLGTLYGQTDMARTPRLLILTRIYILYIADPDQEYKYTLYGQTLPSACYLQRI